MDNRAVRIVVIDTLNAAYDRAAAKFRDNPSDEKRFRDLTAAMVALRQASTMRPAEIAQALGEAHPRNYVRLFSLLAEQD